MSIVTVFVNKALLSGDTVKLDAPLFVTWIQCIVSVVICLLLGLVKHSYLPNPKNVFSANIMRTVSVKTERSYLHPCAGTSNRFSASFLPILLQALPVAVLFTAMVSTNNLCLKYVPVSFYYIGRSLTTVFNVILSYMLLGQTSSFHCILCCAIIVGGFLLGVDQESIAGMFNANHKKF